MSRLIEEWKPVVGYEGLYEVSDWGNVRSLDRVFEYNHPIAKNKGVIRRKFKGQILKKVLNSDGYHVVTLRDYNHKGHEGKVHRLVAAAWIPNLENKPIVGHLKTLEDGTEDKTANEVWNITWMTPEENGNYGTLPQRISERMIGENNHNFGKVLSEDTRRKMSEIRKRNWLEHPEYYENLRNSDKHQEKRKIKVNQYNKETNEFIKTWNSAADVEEELGIWHSNITAACKGKVESAGGYKWRYN